MAAPASDPPRVRVAALIELDGSIVVVRHRKSGLAYHLLPGGGVDAGETLVDALAREVAEETGLLVRPGRLISLNDVIDPRGTRHLVNITFAASVAGGEISVAPLDPRVEAVELIHPDRLDAIDLRPAIAPTLLEALAKGDSYQATYLGDTFVEVRE